MGKSEVAVILLCTGLLLAVITVGMIEIRDAVTACVQKEPQ